MLGKGMRPFTLFLLLLASQAATAISFYNNGGRPVNDTSQVNLLNGLATSLRETDNDVALRYAEEAYQLAHKGAYLKGEAVALGNLGWIYYRRADYVKALQLSIESMKIAEQLGDKAEMA